jgi:hypothetical protein
VTAVRRLTAVTGVVVALAGCASPRQDTPTAPQSPSSNAGAAAPSSASEPDLDITIADGRVSPVNAELDATVGTPIRLMVTSDVVDELHVHAVPERTFTVRPGVSETFEFTVDVPGRVDVELHELHRTVVTIQVRP